MNNVTTEVTGPIEVPVFNQQFQGHSLAMAAGQAARPTTEARLERPDAQVLA